MDLQANSVPHAPLPTGRSCSARSVIGSQEPAAVLEDPSACCSSGCICDQPTNWKTEEISLNHLQELEIEGFEASDHKVAFVKRLLNWVPVLKTMTVTFDFSITESKAKELVQMIRGFSRPDICMKFYTYQYFQRVLFAPED